MKEQPDRPALHGILVIDKPAGWTSHDVVGWVRRWSGERKVGHGGTLDPAATGVLPVALNDGTRVLEFLTDASKAYLAEITFGVVTDSADADGVVTSVAEAAIADEALADALGHFRGPIRQRPPLHSAVKVDGKRAYDLARAGVTTELPERDVTIFALEVLAWKPPVLSVAIECSKGTYIRSIARDLGDRLGCGAYLSNLVRTRSGPFALDTAWPIPELAGLEPAAEWPTIALHPDQGVAGWPSIVIDEAGAIEWSYGRTLSITTADAVAARCRVYDSSGNWLGLADRSVDGECWTPLRVIGTHQ